MTINGIIDLDNGELLEATGKHRISALDIQGSETASFSFTFYQDGNAVTDNSVLNGAVIEFGVKADADFTGTSYKVYHNTFSASSDGLTYTATPTWATSEVESALGNSSSVKLHGQVKIVISGITYYSQVFEVEIHNDVIQAAGETSSVIFPRLITSTSDPTVTDDIGDGYGVSSTWLNTSSNAVHVLIDNTEGAAVWAGFLALTSGVINSNLNLNSKKITGLADGTASADAINKGQLDDLIDNAPAALNTLNELAAALGDDVNFSTTVATNIATKLPLAGGTLSGTLNTLDINLTDPDVAHGITNVAATNVFGNLTTIHGTQGGLYINGISDQESTSARSLALRGICNDAHTDTVPTVEIIGAKRSGTTIQALADAETVLTIANHTTDLLTVLGSGATTFGGAVTVGANTDGHDVKFFGNTSGAYMLWDESTDDLILGGENTRMGIGMTDPDQALEVDGNIKIAGEKYFYLGNTGAGLGSDGSGNFKIRQNDADLIFGYGDNVGIGNAVPASKLHVTGTVQVGADGAGHDVTFHSSTAGRDIHWDASAKTLNLKDLTTLGIGSSNDLQVYHTAHSYIENTTNNLYINNLATGKDTIFKCDDDSGTSTELMRLDGSASSINIPDSVKLNFGAPDLQIYHDGSNSHFKHTGTGSLYLRSSNFYFEKADGSETLAKFISDGAAELYWDGAKKFETLTDGVKVTGAMALTEISTPTATADHGKVYTKSDNKLYFQDGAGTEYYVDITAV